MPLQIDDLIDNLTQSPTLENFDAVVEFCYENYPSPPPFDIEDPTCQEIVSLKNDIVINKNANPETIDPRVKELAIIQLALKIMDSPVPEDIVTSEWFSKFIDKWEDYFLSKETMPWQDIIDAGNDPENIEFADVSDLDRSKYTQSQAIRIAKGRSDSCPQFGNIDELDPAKYNVDQMRYISCARGNNERYGIIDELDPAKYNAEQMRHLSYGRGEIDVYGNIDDLDPSKYDEIQMRHVSVGRGNKTDRANIDDLDPSKYTHSEMEEISINRAIKQNAEK